MKAPRPAWTLNSPEARDLLEGREPRKPTIPEQRSVLEQHFELALAANQTMRNPELHTGKTMRKFGLRFAEHHPRGEEVRQSFIKVASMEDWRGVLEAWYTHDS